MLLNINIKLTHYVQNNTISVHTFHVYTFRFQIFFVHDSLPLDYKIS